MIEIQILLLFVFVFISETNGHVPTWALYRGDDDGAPLP